VPHDKIVDEIVAVLTAGPLPRGAAPEAPTPGDTVS
jgi:hypothetical protein